MNFSTLKLGRILFALPFAVFGILHFMNASAMAGMVPLPGGVFWVYLTGVALIAAAVSMLIGKYARLAALLLGVMLFIFVLSIHLPDLLGGNQQAMSNLLKDFALGGAAWALADTFPAETDTETGM
ncbi:MAG: DoxX family membrane protein [Bacteroidetes bacterium]|jgi:uncharacterized membrane protein YphA (DoxX/SURF4 family)|nr:DoxX family membrane protein [Bacteroidota bacterium]